MGKEETAQKILCAILQLQKLYDPESGWMRGKTRIVSSVAFNPLKWGDAFTEGNSLHYTWSVFPGCTGIVDLMGGKKPL